MKHAIRLIAVLLTTCLMPLSANASNFETFSNRNGDLNELTNMFLRAYINLMFHDSIKCSEASSLLRYGPYSHSIRDQLLNELMYIQDTMTSRQDRKTSQALKKVYGQFDALNIEFVDAMMSRAAGETLTKIADESNPGFRKRLEGVYMLDFLPEEERDKESLWWGLKTLVKAQMRLSKVAFMDPVVIDCQKTLERVRAQKLTLYIMLLNANETIRHEALFTNPLPAKVSLPAEAKNVYQYVQTCVEPKFAVNNMISLFTPIDAIRNVGADNRALTYYENSRSAMYAEIWATGGAATFDYSAYNKALGAIHQKHRKLVMGEAGVAKLEAAKKLMDDSEDDIEDIEDDISKITRQLEDLQQPGEQLTDEKKAELETEKARITKLLNEAREKREAANVIAVELNKTSDKVYESQKADVIALQNQMCGDVSESVRIRKKYFEQEKAVIGSANEKADAIMKEWMNIIRSI